MALLGERKESQIPLLLSAKLKHHAAASTPPGRGAVSRVGWRDLRKGYELVGVELFPFGREVDGLIFFTEQMRSLENVFLGESVIDLGVFTNTIGDAA